MRDSFRVFMEGIIDYAGLFPPADLSLDTAIRNFAGYREGGHSWMLSRFIIPAGRLADLNGYSEWLSVEDAPFEYSVLGSATETIGDYNGEIENVFDKCVQFNSDHPGAVQGDLLEIKLPKEAVFSCDEKLLTTVFDHSAKKLDKNEEVPDRVYYEIDMEENWKKDVSTTLKSLARHNSENERDSYRYAGFKLRCGGVEPDDFPGAEQVAYILNRARDVNVPLKCTAGLHHPVRHFSYDVQTKMHGFFNLFGGAMLSYANQLDDRELMEIISEEDSGQFTFQDDSFGWNDLTVSTEEIKKLRNYSLVSFGSCSFEEPRDDLQELELL